MRRKRKQLNLELVYDCDMKKLLYIVLLIGCFACDSESANDCFQTEGDIIQELREVSSFERILVNRDVELILSEGTEVEVLVESGANLINDVKVNVVGNQLELTDDNSCNFVRDYGITKIYVTAPNITEIRNSSQYEVSSNGVLNFPELELFSEDAIAPGSFTVGDFRLTLNSNSVRIVSNNISSFYLTGETVDLNIGFFSGAGRFEGESFVAQNVSVFHRGSNDMIVNPQTELVGELRGTGDLITVNTPPIINVQQFYTGQLIIED